MKRLSVLLLASFALISCGNKPSLSESFSDSQNEESLLESQAGESEESTLQESESSSNESESTPEIDEEDKVYNYTSHPTSEPHINYQLHTLSAIGDIYSVWEHYRGDGVKVAVIDNNFRVTHEDFYFENGQSKITSDSARIYKSGSKVITEVGVDKAGIDASSNWHGTMCAGLLGASVNGKGTTGIAPNCDLTLIKVDNSPEAIAEAFKYAADCGVKVISISLGNYALSNGATYGDIVYPKGFDLSTAFNESINYAYNKGVTIVSAVGNDKKTTLTYPAGCENVIGAGGLQSGSLDKMWDDGGEGTNYNGTSKYVDVYAPSSGIYTPGSQSNSGYMDGPSAKGTSFSAPIIAGAAALYFQKYPTHTNKDFETALQKTCRNISSANSNKDTGWGALDVYKLLNLNEDVEDVYFQPTKTINEEATTIRIYDENSWCFRSLHTWGFEFEDGYGYRDLEYFFFHQYGQRTLTKNYQIESEKRSWAYTDEYFVGDYFLNAGSLIGDYYEFNFPSWVKSFSYQSVNNNHWIPENGGYNTGNGSAYKKVSNVYINNGQTYLVVDSKTNTISMPAIEISFEGSLSMNPIIQSVYNYFNIEENGKSFFLDKNKNELYYRQIFRQNTILYVSDI